MVEIRGSVRTYKNMVRNRKPQNSFWQKYKGLILIVFVLAAMGIGYGYLQRNQVRNSKTEEQIPTVTFDRTVKFTDTFYYDQLNDRQKKAYDMIMQRYRDKEGGMIVFEEALNGEDYSCVISAVKSNDEGLFYGFVDAPLSEDDFYLKRKVDKISDLKEQEIKKVFLFLYTSKGINEAGSFDDQGYMVNATEMDQLMRENNPERLAEVESIQKESEEILLQVIEDLPEGVDQKEAVDYYMDWLNKNLKYDAETDQMNENAGNLEEEFRKRYFASDISCVVEGRAVGAGYGKTLTWLLNRSGISAYNLIGTVSKVYVHGITGIPFGDTVYFADPSPAWEEQKYGHRYFTASEAGYYVVPIPYFNYKIEK